MSHEKSDNIDKHIFMEEVLNFLDEDISQMSKKYMGNFFTRRSQSVDKKNQISRNVDYNKVKDKLSKIPSHYKSLNNSKHDSFSSSIVKSKPPYNVFVSHRII